MGIYKNGKNKNFYYSLCHKGKRFQGSTGLSNHDEATIFFLELKNKITNKKKNISINECLKGFMEI